MTNSLVFWYLSPDCCRNENSTPNERFLIQINLQCWIFMNLLIEDQILILALTSVICRRFLNANCTDTQLDGYNKYWWSVSWKAYAFKQSTRRFQSVNVCWTKLIRLLWSFLVLPFGGVSPRNRSNNFQQSQNVGVYAKGRKYTTY